MKINTKGKYVLVVCPNPSIDIYATVGDFQVGSTNRILNEERFPGGKGVHVAMALAELGVDIVLLGFWGSGTGQWIKNQCHERFQNIKCIGPELEGWSRSCYTFKSDGSFGDTELLGTGPQIDKKDQTQILDVFVKHISKAKAVALSGSWPSGAKGNEYAKMIKIAHSSSIPAFLDCTGSQLENALVENPYCIHLNSSEVLAFTDTDNFESAKDQIDKLCEVVAITNGAKGLYYFKGNNMIHSNVKIEKVYSTVGAGDCLLAGIIAGHVKKLDDKGIANLGAVCGAANCIHPELGILKRKDVERLLSTVENPINP